MHVSERSTGKTSTWLAGKEVSQEGSLPCTTKVALSGEGGLSPNKISVGNLLQKVLMKSNEESSISVAIPEGKEIQGP